MRCLFPIQIKYQDFLGYDRYIDAPCGKCHHCLKNRQNDWSIRLYEESRDWLHIDFVTFTYNDHSLPVNVEVDHLTGEVISRSSLRMKDVSDAIKRFRTRYFRLYGENLDLKYFFCGEYGSRGSKRPHYHALIYYNCDPLRLKALYQDWRNTFGFVHDKHVNISSTDRKKVSIYVSKYLTKSFFCSRQEEINAGLIERPRYIMSKGIGSGYIERSKSWHTHCDVDVMVDRMFYSFGDKFRYSLPRYYKDRFYHKKEFVPVVDYEYTFENINQVAEIRSAKYVTRFTCQNYLSFTIADIVRKRHIVKLYKDIRASQGSLGPISPSMLASYFLAQKSDFKFSSRDLWLNLAKFANKSHFSSHSSS